MTEWIRFKSLPLCLYFTGFLIFFKKVTEDRDEKLYSGAL